MNKVIYRSGRETMEADELSAAKLHFPCFSRSDMIANVSQGDLVVGRYSVLPFYKEFESDVNALGAKLINTYQQHRYIADLSEWYLDLQEFTFETWFDWNSIPDNVPVVVKGKTNSRKFSWNTHMFASNKIEAGEIVSRLSDDALIGLQDCVFRRYVPLRKYFDGYKGLPITEEYRFFVYDGKILSSGFYWSNHVEDIDDKPDASRVPAEFLQKVISKIQTRAPFVVVDVAKTANDQWIVVELNDGQMSGLSENLPDVLYSNLNKVLSQR